MPTWGELLRGMQARAEGSGLIPLDEVRREALQKLSTMTERPVIVYAARWVQPDPTPVPPSLTSIAIGDVHGFMEVLHGVRGPAIDIILHSPGGSPTAAEAIVNYIRTKFDDVRVIVPLAAMSAATMLACSANRILMGKHSFLGPIDPQLILQTPLGPQSVPAHAIRAQFEMAVQDAANPQRFPAWIPMLQQYGPALLVTCDNAIKLSQELVTEWLAKWMFKDDAAGKERADQIAKRLNEHDAHRTHARFLSRDAVKTLGLIVEDLEQNQDLQDAILTVFHALSLTFTFNAGVTKLIENHLGKAFMTMRQVQQPVVKMTKGPQADDVVPIVPVPPDDHGAGAPDNGADKQDSSKEDPS